MLAFFNSTYHYFLRSIVNIFRLETGVSFFNTTYHDFLRCIVNIFRFEIGASFFFHTTYHDSFRFIVNIYGFQSPTTLRTAPSQPLSRPSLPQHSIIDTSPSPLPPTPGHGNITVSDDFFVAAILAAICSAFSALAPMFKLQILIVTKQVTLRVRAYLRNSGTSAIYTTARWRRRTSL